MHYYQMKCKCNYHAINIYNYRLEEDMSSVDREVTPWVIFGGHRAMYVNSGYGGNKSSSTYVV